MAETTETGGNQEKGAKKSMSPDAKFTLATLFAAPFGLPAKMMMDRLVQQKTGGMGMTDALLVGIGIRKREDVTLTPVEDAPLMDGVTKIPMIGTVLEPIASAVSAIGNRDIKGAVNAAAAAKKATSAIQTTGTDVTPSTTTPGGPSVS